MATIAKLVPGQTLWDVHNYRNGVGHSVKGTWTVRVEEVDPEGKWVLASWNNNPVRRYYPRQVAKWRVKKPEPKK